MSPSDLLGADPAATGTHTEPALPTAEHLALGRAAPPAAGRYLLGEEVARGGAVASRATDTALGREVLVHMPPGDGFPQRFLDDARLVARLRHPGIPPVLDSGTLPDGRPFLATVPADGDTLDMALKGRPCPVAARGRFVAAFEKVCEAVAYAHAQGAVHGDLRPGRVVVGAFGEAWVTGWPPTGGADPSFTPPEPTAATPRGDVYGLGGILAFILTGRPPAAAVGGQLDGCGAGPELVALAKRCLAPDPADRPADAGEVVRALATARQAADTRRAGRDRGPEQSAPGRWLAVAVAGLVLAAGLAVTSVGWLRARADRDAETVRRAEVMAERERAERGRGAAEQARGAAEADRDAAVAALAAEARARKAADEGHALTRAVVTREVPDLLRRADSARDARQSVAALLAAAVGKTPGPAGGPADPAAFQVHMRLGDLRGADGAWAEARAHYDAALAIGQRLLTAAGPRATDQLKLDHAAALRARGVAAREGHDRGAALTYLRSAERLQREVPAAAARAALADTLHEIAVTHARRDEHAAADAAAAEAVRLRRDALAEPGGVRPLAESLVLLGELRAGRQPAEAAAALAEAADLYQREVDADRADAALRREAARACRLLAAQLGGAGRAEEARLYADRDVELSRGPFREPEVARAGWELFRAYSAAAGLARDRGDRDQARELYRRGAAVGREVAAGRSGDAADRVALAVALAWAGDHTTAAALAAAERDRNPLDLRVRHDAAHVFAVCADAVLAGRAEAELGAGELALRRRYLDAALESLEFAARRAEFREQAAVEIRFPELRNEARYRPVVNQLRRRVGVEPLVSLAPPPREVRR